MASGTIQVGVEGFDTMFRIDWESRYNKAINKSNVKLSYYFIRWDEAEGGDLKIKGKLYAAVKSWVVGTSSEKEYIIPANSQWTLMYSADRNIEHDSDRTCECTIRADVSCAIIKNGETIPKAFNFSFSEKVEFDTNDDQAVLYGNTKVENGVVTFVYKPTAYTYNKAFVTFEGENGKEVRRTWELGYSPSLSTPIWEKFELDGKDIEEIYTINPNRNNSPVLIYLISYKDPQYTQLAAGAIKYYTLNREMEFPTDETTMPTGELRCEPVSSLEGNLAKLYWPTRSKIKAEILNDAGKYGATIVSKKIQIATQEGDSPLTSGIIAGTNPITVRGTITDSRGISRTLEQVITPVAYGTPQIKPYGDNAAIVVARCDKDGNLTDEGTQFKIAAKREFTKINYEGEQITFCSLSYRVKKIGEAFNDEWITILEDKAPSDEKEIVIGSAGAYNIEQAYVVQLKAEDSIGNSIVLTFNLPSDKVYMHRSGKNNALALGGYATQTDSFEVYWQSVLHGGLILKSESGDRYFRITVDENGVLSASSVSEAQTFLLRGGNK